ncbi:MAG: (E)-4-hydroxy-3-methylbut-2-enyl-diphosphate synthase [Myxococcota bacterium]
MSAPFDPFRPTRRPTRVVRVGDVGIGGGEPIRVQSMTNTNTLDTRATVEQATRLAEVGCEIVRITAPSIRDAENLRAIKQALRDRRVFVPLVADIHFTPNAAMIAAEIVEKVRINPGNYADKKRFEVREYDDASYAAELERVAERFRPLVLRCRQNGVAMRIGTNHGSLSDRIMNRFGDTPEGMVESALEFLDVCESERYFDVVFSMKSSNTQVAIAAYRLLAARLAERADGAPSYPFHVGVTEAGDAEDGRIKSAIGIGALLEDGIGDTIRVSLTEDPVREIPVARTIARIAGESARTPRDTTDREGADPASAVAARRAPPRTPPFADPFAHARRATEVRLLRGPGAGLPLGGDEPVRVELDRPSALEQPAETAAQLAVELAALRDVVCESLLVTARTRDEAARIAPLVDALASLGLALPISLRVDPPAFAEAASIVEAGLGSAQAASFPLARVVFRIVEATTPGLLASVVRVAQGAQTERPAAREQAARSGPAARGGATAIEWEIAGTDESIAEHVAHALAAAPDALFSRASGARPHSVRRLVSVLADAGAGQSPLVLRQDVSPGGQGAIAEPVRAAGRSPVAARSAASAETPGAGPAAVSEARLVEASVRLGSVLCDGIGDLLSLRSDGPAAAVVDLAYRILQGARLRTTRTEYISCPSCGRTLFDLEETTARIKQRTAHLSGVKIAVMGCIVNGPGEMADADFGYVGSGVGQVTLYVGKEVVERAVPEAEAPDRLVELIRKNGRWVDA